MLDHAGDSAAVEVPEAGLLHVAADEGGIAADMVVAPVHVRSEVDLDLEQLTEVVVDSVQAMEERGRADEHHLGSERDWVRRETGCGRGGELLAQALDAELPCTQRPLQSVPGHGAAEHVRHLENKKATVGTMQRTGPHLPEVRDHGPQDPPVLDAPEQVVVSGVGLKDHRCPREATVVDKYVDAVATRALLRSGCLPGRSCGRRVSGAGPELVDVVRDVRTDALEM